MKIKYIDKFHKKIKEDSSFKNKLIFGIGMSVLSATIFTISFQGGKMLYKNDINNKIIETTYKVEDKSYALKDIYILYKDKEIIKCRREEVVEENTLSKKIYKFYDIKTNEMIAFTEYNQISNNYISEKNKENDTKNMNGYKYINLGEVMKSNAYNDHYKINQNYINDYIENKRFLGR